MIDVELPEGWHIEYNPKPVPPRLGVDWDFWHDDYDGENDLHGTGSSERDCLIQIWEKINEKQ